MDHCKHILAEANQLARIGEVPAMYEALRKLPLADFCMIHIHSPTTFEHLAKLLPKMPSADVQKRWVGDAGAPLMARSCSLVRLFDLLSWRSTGSGLTGKKILDYGCGWGRLLRLMNYYSDPDLVLGVDAMQQSLDLCAASGLHNKTALVASRPTPLDSSRMGEGFDFVYLFSVFSHTPKDVTLDILKYIHSVTKADALVVATIRSVDWLKVRQEVWPSGLVSKMRDSYQESEYGFVPLNGDDGALAESEYGDTIMTPGYFDKLARTAGWQAVGIDRDVLEPFQIGVSLVKA